MRTASAAGPRTRSLYTSRRHFETSGFGGAAPSRRTWSRVSSNSPSTRESARRTSTESSTRSRSSRGSSRRAGKGRNRRGHLGAPMADAREAFAKALHEGHEREHDQRWQDAVDVYSKLLSSLPPTSDRESRAIRAIALMRSGNALMELRRWDD